MILVTSKAKGVLYFYPDPTLVTQECLPVRGFIGAFSNHPFFILGASISTKQKCFEKLSILRRLNNDIFTIFSTGTRQKLSPDEQSPPSILSTVKMKKDCHHQPFKTRNTRTGTNQLAFVTNIHYIEENLSTY